MTLDRKIIPKPNKQSRFLLPKIIEFKIGEFLNVHFVQKNNLPIVRFGLISDVGSTIDPNGKKGLANLFSMLIDEGAGKFDSMQLKEQFQILGTNLSIGASKDSCSFSFLTLKENFDRSLELLNLILNEPNFKEDEFKKEKDKLLTGIQQIKDSPDDIADLAFDSLIFNNTSSYSYPTSGYAENVESITLDDVKNFYKSIFLQSSINIVVVGDIAKEELENKIRKFITPWKSTIKKKSKNIFVVDTKTKIYFADKKESVQSEIRVGHITCKRNETDFYSNALLNTILGGQFSSRINLNLREDKGYTYGAHSGFNYYKNAGYFYVTTSVEGKFTSAAIKEILFEMKKIKKGVTEEELTFAKSSIIKRFPLNFETYGQIASNLTNKIEHNLSISYYNNYVKNISNVDNQMIKNSAENFIRPDNAVIMVVGDKKNILPQLEDLNKYEVIEVDNYGKIQK
ncbi:MAG TPA: insulinase family protein [Ignavibacteria bacterium]|nr:insulinase family protein [Ignavibacteria bacterium]